MREPVPPTSEETLTVAEVGLIDIFIPLEVTQAAPSERSVHEPPHGV